MATAIQAIYRDMEYAKSLIKNRNTAAGADNADDPATADEESWTFIEEDEETASELAKRMAAWDGVRTRGDTERVAGNDEGGSGRRRRVSSISKASKSLLQKMSNRELKAEKATD